MRPYAPICAHMRPYATSQETNRANLTFDPVMSDSILIPPRATFPFTFTVDQECPFSPVQLKEDLSAIPSVIVEDSFVEGHTLTVYLHNHDDDPVHITEDTRLGSYVPLTEDKFAVTSGLIFPEEWTNGLQIPPEILPLLEQYRSRINSRQYEIQLPEAEININISRPIYRKPYRLSEEKRKFVLEQYRIWKA